MSQLETTIQPIENLAHHLCQWQEIAGRHNLPWQIPALSPYRVWVSEIMLQQTQVQTVKRYFIDFMARWPSLACLASAPEEEILQAWSGLGYYRRARNLHAAAQLMQSLYQQVPNQYEQLLALPGIGRSTAGAILSLGFNQAAPILDGNVKRVFARLHGIQTWPGARQTEKALWQLAHSYVPTDSPAQYNQALMDLGATICTPKSPDCPNCPVAAWCFAMQHQQTSDLPVPPPKKEKQRQTIEFFLIKHQGKFWLTRRPELGLWAKYWCFPEANEHLRQLIFNTHQDMIDQVTEHHSIQHTLTHRQLTLLPTLIEVNKQFDFSIVDPSGEWCTHEELLAKALPKPVHKCLAQLQNHS